MARRLAERIATVQATGGAPVTVGDLTASWLERSAPTRMSASSLATVQSLIDVHVLPVFGSVPLAAVTVEQVEGWLDARVDLLAKSTLRKLKAVMGQIFDYGVRRRAVTWNPARHAELPPGASQRRQGRALNADEVKRLIAACEHDRAGAWVITALTLGLRPGECSALSWDAVGPDTVTIFRSVSWVGGTNPTLKPPKTGKTRTLQLPAVTAVTLKAHRKVQAEERLLMAGRWPGEWSNLCFTTSNGTPYGGSHLRRIVANIAKTAGIEGKVTPYDLRHTSVSLMIDAGLSAERVADHHGHADLRMIYAFYKHPVVESISAAAEYWGR